jgi:hypothetical protein
MLWKGGNKYSPTHTHGLQSDQRALSSKSSMSPYGMGPISECPAVNSVFPCGYTLVGRNLQIPRRSGWATRGSRRR